MNWGKLIIRFFIFQSIVQIISYLSFKKMLRKGFDNGGYDIYRKLIFPEMKRREPNLSDEDCFNRFVFAYPPSIFLLFIPIVGLGIVGFLKMYAVQGNTPEEQERLSNIYINNILR